MKTCSSKLFFYWKNRRERCPHCGFLDVIASYGLNGGFLESKQLPKYQS